MGYMGSGKIKGAATLADAAPTQRRCPACACCACVCARESACVNLLSPAGRRLHPRHITASRCADGIGAHPVNGQRGVRTGGQKCHREASKEEDHHRPHWPLLSSPSLLWPDLPSRRPPKPPPGQRLQSSIIICCLAGVQDRGLHGPEGCSKLLRIENKIETCRRRTPLPPSSPRLHHCAPTHLGVEEVLRQPVGAGGRGASGEEGGSVGVELHGDDGAVVSC